MKTLGILLLASFAVWIILAQAPTGASALAAEQNPPSDSSRPEPDERNLLTNPNFEDGTAGWELCNWGKNSRMEVDRSELHEGKLALRVENLEACHSFIRQVITGKPNTRYQLSGYIKTRRVEPANRGGKSGAVLEVGRMGIYTPLMVGTRQWTKVTVDFTTKDDPEIRVGPSLGTDPAFALGTAWFSELRLTEFGEDERK
jgi:Carbohydrate binding domain